MIKILLLADYSREPERRLLRGLVKYANAHGGCTLYNLSSFNLKTRGHSSEIIRSARTLGVDAIFGTWMDPGREDVAALGIPVFLRTVDTMYDYVPMLSGLYEEIGRCAAEFFLRQHYDHLAYIGNGGLIWSEERWKGFSGRISENALTADSFMVTNAIQQREEIVRWLQGLPKPVGIFACNDIMARTVNELCSFSGLQIPSQIALLGADNDEFLCNISSPAISSINLDFETQGYRLGEAIFRMVREKRIWPERIPIEPTEIIERESTIKVRTADKYVLKVLDQIESGYTRDIDVADIVKSIPLSRRTIELRFKHEMNGETISHYLSSMRVNRLCTLLHDVELSINQAALQAGFADVTNVGRVFKKFKGMSPSEYRKRVVK